MVKCRFDSKVICDSSGDHDWCSSCVQLEAPYYNGEPWSDVTTKNSEPYNHSLGATERGDLPSRNVSMNDSKALMVAYLKKDVHDYPDSIGSWCVSNHDCADCSSLEACYLHTKENDENKRSETTDMLDAVDDAVKQAWPDVRVERKPTVADKKQAWIETHQDKLPTIHCLACENQHACINNIVLFDEKPKCEKAKEEQEMTYEFGSCGMCDNNLHSVKDWLCSDCQRTAIKLHEKDKMNQREQDAYHNDLKKVGKWSVIISAITGGLWYGLPILVKGANKGLSWIATKISNGLHGINDATVVIKNFGIPYPMQAIILFAIVMGCIGTFSAWWNKYCRLYARDD